jgi:tRNA(adenine34) deaminase
MEFSLSESQQWMRLAIAQAQQAAAIAEVPIGCVIHHGPSNRIIGAGYNQRESSHDACAHAEILAIRQAGLTLSHWRLLDCTLIVTLEPCPMCAGAIVNARIPRLIYGCSDLKAGAIHTLYRICDDQRLNHRAEIIAGVLAEECAELLRRFFQIQRTLGKK